MHDAGCLGLVHWDDPEGWYGEGGGRRVQDGEHMRNKGINLKKKINKIKFTSSEKKKSKRLKVLVFRIKKHSDKSIRKRQIN